jgi:hypothetical protein
LFPSTFLFSVNEDGRESDYSGVALERAKRKWWPIPLGVASNSLVKKYGNYLLQKRRGFHTFGKGRTRHLSIQPFG